MPETFDLAIIGGGPAGVAAGVYAARKKIKTIFLTDTFESQSTVSLEIQNWIGESAISGNDLTKKLEAHLRAYAGDSVTIKTKEKVTAVSKKEDNFEIKTAKNSYSAKAVLITTGSQRKKLNIVGADKYEGKGIVYCATCDAPLFGDKNVVVIGGGNSAFESAIQLFDYCKSVTLINRRNEFRADPITVQKASENPKLKILKNTIPVEVKGDNFVKSLVVKNLETNEQTELAIEGIFVEIGHIPSTSFAKDLVETTPEGNIKIDHKTQRTSLSGIWSAGDCTDGLYQQNNIAVGDAIKALEDIYRWLKK
ncbi:MAG: FAD-dependent oxidoreductase [Candidatus Paceibacterota bacterium]